MGEPVPLRLCLFFVASGSCACGSRYASGVALLPTSTSASVTYNTRAATVFFQGVFLRAAQDLARPSRPRRQRHSGGPVKKRPVRGPGLHGWGFSKEILQAACPHASTSTFLNVRLARMFHTGFLRMGGTGYQPVLVGNLPTRLGRAPCRHAATQSERLDVVLPPGW